MNTTWQGPIIKLTDAAHTTQNLCQWGKRVENPHGVRHGHNGLCGSGFYHGYDTTPELAQFLNPMHGNIKNPVIWLAEWRGVREDDKCLKMGATEMRTIRILKVLVPTTLQRTIFSILAAEFTLDAVDYDLSAWREWAEKFMSGEDRSESAARSAARSAAWSAESAAAESAARSAAWSAAESAAWSAGSAESAAARSAAESAWSAARSAESAESAAALNILENAAAFAMSRSWETLDL